MCGGVPSSRTLTDSTISRHAPTMMITLIRTLLSGVCPQPAEHDDQDAGNDRRDRAEQVAHDVQERAAHVQVVLMARVQQICRNDIDDKPAGGDQQHRRSL